MTVLLIDLYLFIPLSVTSGLFQRTGKVGIIKAALLAADKACMAMFWPALSWKDGTLTQGTSFLFFRSLCSLLKKCGKDVEKMKLIQVGRYKWLGRISGSRRAYETMFRTTPGLKVSIFDSVRFSAERDLNFCVRTIPFHRKGREQSKRKKVNFTHTRISGNYLCCISSHHQRFFFFSFFFFFFFGGGGVSSRTPNSLFKPG